MARKATVVRQVSPRQVAPPAPKVAFVRNELSNLLPAYQMIHDAIHGELAIKGITGSVTTGIAGIGNGGLPMSVINVELARAQRYLPMPNPEDQSADNINRYKAYVTRAVWYGATGRTLEGMAGQIFLRNPEMAFIPQLDMLKVNADGSGLTLDQMAYRAVRFDIAYGRTGLLVDYPVMDGPATAKQIASGEVQPTFTVYHPSNIINWRVEQVGAKKRLTLVVLRETEDVEGDDGFQLTVSEQYRVLRLDPTSGDHVVEIYRKQGQNLVSDGPTMPRDAKGLTLKEIPFKFIGAENNDIAPNRPPLYDLAALNIAHYRNSADYEESCFIAGQPTPVFTGLTEDWVNNVLKGQVPLGSRASVPLPVGASAQLLQAQPNSQPYEAMKQKEEQMVALGAKLVQIQRSQRSATEQIIETTSESSILANIAFNVSDAFEWGLGVASAYVSKAKPEKLKYQLNSDFDLTSMTADDQNTIIKQWQSGAISFTEMRSGLKKAGIATQDDKEARTEIEADIKSGMIPDPAMVSASMSKVPDAKGASAAGGPQPNKLRRQSKPQGSQ